MVRYQELIVTIAVDPGIAANSLHKDREQWLIPVVNLSITAITLRAV